MSAFDNIPQELRALRQWALWRKEPKPDKPGKFKKVPYYINGVKRHGTQGGDEDRAALATFEQVLAVHERGAYDGIGLAMLREAGFIALDLDDCYQHGQYSPEANEIARECDTYGEVSPSGNGLRFFYRGDIPPSDSLPRYIEVFHKSGFVTVTGSKINGAEILPMPNALRARIEELIAQKRKVGKKQGRRRRDELPLDRAIGMLGHIDPDDRQRWLNVGIILGRLYVGTQHESEAWAAYDAWAARSPKHQEDHAGNLNRMKEMFHEESQKERANPLGVGSLIEWAREGGWTDGREEITLRAGELPEFVDECVAVLAAAGDVYKRAGRLVHVLRVDEAALHEHGIRRDPAQLVIAPVSPDALRVKLGRRVVFVKYGAKGQVSYDDCPAGHARALAAQGEWADMPPLLGIADAPTLRADGSVAQAPGYDAASGLLLNLEGEWPTVPDRPTRAQAKAALALLLEPFREFPFETDEAKAAFAAAMLTAAVRSTLPTAPAIYIIGPSAGAGKTLLADGVATIASGRFAPKRMLPFNDDEEMRKVITAALNAGDRMLVFDNIPRGHCVRSPALDNALTSGVWADRLLGTNEQIALPFALTVVLTGNNISCHTDAVRRGVYVHIDPKTEFPEQREFTIPDLLGHLRERRRELLVAALTVLRGYVVAGERQTVTPLGSFEAWSQRVREAVVWAGMKDPVATQARMRSDDEDRNELDDLLKQLELNFRSDWFRATNVIVRLAANDGLRAVVEQWGEPSAKSVGKQLRARCGQIANGRQLVSRIDPGDKINEFKVEAKF